MLALLSSVNTWYSKNKTLVQGIIISVIVFICIFFAIRILTPKPTIPLDLKYRIDSLSKANLDLKNQVSIRDSSIAFYKDSIITLNDKYDSIDDVKTNISKQYQKINSKIGKYTSTQVDSFFKQRYNYR